MADFNINTFNEILLAHTKDEESKRKLLEAELAMVYDLFIEEMGKLLDELEETGYKSEQFQTLSNIKNNSVQIVEQLQEMEEKAKLKEAYKSGKTHADIKKSFQ